MTGSTGFAVLRPKNDNYRELTYLAATAPENIERLAHLADGAAYPAVKPETVVGTAILVFDMKTFQCFSEVTRPLIHKLEANKREFRTLAEMRDFLLPKLMSGEIGLKQAEKLVNQVA